MKTVLITGANKSIGFETAKELAGKGYFVYLGSRNAERGATAVAQLKALGLDNVAALTIDVCSSTSIGAAVETVNSKSGSLDVLINNAGIPGGFPQDASTTDIDTVRTVFETNFFGVINVTQGFIPLLKKSTSPIIVNVTSGLGSLTLHSDPSWVYYNFKSAAYGPSKTALNAYTIALAFELRELNFKVNAVDPGYTATDFNHHTGHGTAASAAAFVSQFAMLGTDGPTGKYFSLDSNTPGNESPW